MRDISEINMPPGDLPSGSMLSDRRPGYPGPATGEDASRSPFETDGDKIIFSSAFRALADKTQVHDRVEPRGHHRNRLTHSMEVSRVGRSLGMAVAAGICNGDEARMRDISHAVAAACLAHDVGNPPFGHLGEEAVSAFFRETDHGRFVADRAAEESPRLAAELGMHEGNAQGWRMITRTAGWRQGAGLALTAATLGAFLKYPFMLDDETVARSRGASGKIPARKYGVFGADAAVLEQVAALTGMDRLSPTRFARHPLAYLTEAADDICYLIVDMEDGVGLGYLSEAEMVELVAPLLDDAQLAEARGIETRAERLHYLRSRAIRALVRAAADAFSENRRGVMSGRLGETGSGPLPDKPAGLMRFSRAGDALERIRAVSVERIYRAPAMQAARDSQFEALQSFLFLVFERAILAEDGPDPVREGARSDLAAMLGLDPGDPCGPGGRPIGHAGIARRILDRMTLLPERHVLEVVARWSGRGVST